MIRPRLFAATLVAALASVAAISAPAAETDRQRDTSIPTVVIIGVTPLQGAEIDRNQVAAPVQTVSAADIERRMRWISRRS